jgi:3',5'-cyclic AMP phosphodiesterase CpdA
MLVAHLSDLHVTHPESPVAMFADGAAALAAAVEHLNGLERPVDAVVITGDLVNDGTVAEYEQLRTLLDPLTAPYYLLAGNHDEPGPLREVFPEHTYLPTDRPLHWVVDDHDLRIVAVDTTVEGRHDGELAAGELAWLDDELRAEPDRPTLVLMHHPPFVTGMYWMDYGGLDNADALQTMLGHHPQVVGVLAGHVHRMFHLAWGSTMVSTAPATTYQSLLALRDDSRPLVADVVAPISLLRWTGDHLLAAHTDYRLPHRTLDLSTVIPNWDTYEAACRAGGPIPKDH